MRENCSELRENKAELREESRQVRKDTHNFTKKKIKNLPILQDICRVLSNMSNITRKGCVIFDDKKRTDRVFEN